MPRGLLAIAACLLFAVCAPAGANDVAGMERVRFRSYSTQQGLPQATVRAVAQGADGFLWLGTQDGLARFDGYSFRIYRHDRNQPWSISDNHITALLADDAGLWVATQSGGLNRYDPHLDRFTRHLAERDRSDTLASNYVTAMARTGDGRLWLATTDGRLQWLENVDGPVHTAALGSLPALRMVRAMLPLADGSLMLGTLDGLWRFDPASTALEEWRADADVPLNVYALARSPDGSIWVGSADSGMYRFDADGTFGAHHRHVEDGDPHASLHDDAVRGLLFDRDGLLWIAGNTHGLASMDTRSGRFEYYTHDPARPDTVTANQLWCLFEDRDGLLVIGSWVNGFSLHDPRTRAFVLIDSVADDPRTLPTRPIRTVHADADGTLWMGAIEGGGLVHFDLARGVLARYTHDPADPGSLGHDFVQFVTRSRDGSLWIATAGGGLDRLRPGAAAFEHFRHDPRDPASLASDSLLTVHEDRAGTLWVGTADRGLDERCAGCSGFRHHRHDPANPASLLDASVSDVLETRAGELWVATRAGLLRYDRKHDRFERFAARVGDPRAPASDSISTLAEDSLGNIWIGTQGGGVNRRVVDASGNVHFDIIDTHSGLAADAIGTMVEDARGRMWVSTTAGISRIDRDGGIVNLGPRDGTQALGYWTNSGARLPDGRIVFGGLGGATLFDPDAVTPPVVPRPLVTGLLLRNVPVELAWQQEGSPLATSLWRGHEVTLAHDQDNVTFEFSGGVFSDPESIRYAYRLEGHDRSWIDTPSSRRLATYTDLSPGDYSLRVRARRDGGVWSDAPAISVRVLPSPWASPFAYSMYGLGLLVLALLAGLQLRAGMRNRRQVQESIRASEERLKLALWGSGSELWDVDLLSGQLHRENQLDHLAATHDVTQENVASYLPFVHPDDIARVRDALARHLDRQAPVFEASYRTRNREQEWVWLLTRGRVVQRDDDDRALRMAGTNSDITALNQALGALRLLNEQLESRVEQRTAALQDANRELRNTLDRLTQAQRQLFESEKLASLGGMVAGIAHEINTPLGIGVTAASHLQEEARRMLRLLDAANVQPDDLARFSHAARESSDLILRNLQRADRLVKSFKRVAVDQSSEDRRVVDLGACLDEILMTLGPTLKKTLHRVELECPPDFVVTTAPGVLYQVVTNLVMNSLTHGFEAGVAGNIRLMVSRDGDEVVIDYVDDGQGMEESVRQHVFEPFFTTRRGQGGSGLGMHIVYSLVTQVLQGRIDCTSAPGAGARFLIRFPGWILPQGEQEQRGPIPRA